MQSTPPEQFDWFLQYWAICSPIHLFNMKAISSHLWFSTTIQSCWCYLQTTLQPAQVVSHFSYTYPKGLMACFWIPRTLCKSARGWSLLTTLQWLPMTRIPHGMEFWLMKNSWRHGELGDFMSESIPFLLSFLRSWYYLFILKYLYGFLK